MAHARGSTVPGLASEPPPRDPFMQRRQLICWRPHALAHLADELLCYARAAHAESAARNPVYAAWLRRREETAVRLGERGAPLSADR